MKTDRDEIYGYVLKITTVLDDSEDGIITIAEMVEELREIVQDMHRPDAEAVKHSHD